MLGNLWGGFLPRLAATQRQVLLPDGDRLVIHDSLPPRWQPGDPVALLVHGLGGSHESGYMRRLTRLLLPGGVRVSRMDLRGAGAGAGLARGTYNAACSGDVRVAANELHRTSPNSPVVLVGFSLGGNIVLKLAGEAARQPVPGLQGVAAVAPPIDVLRCAELLALFPFYDRFFVRSLVRQVRCQELFFPERPPVQFPRRATLRMFDDLYTAPRGGFADALDYYRRASALPLMGDIQVPTFILTAADDPFIDVAMIRRLPQAPNREIHISERGGHLGFLGWDGAGGIRWAERKLAEWIVANMFAPDAARRTHSGR
jgi:predicted alpha/beta-fold hydrolase